MAKASRKHNPQARMRLVEHLQELRRRLVISAITILVASFAGWLLADFVWDLLRAPVDTVAAETGRQAKIAYTDVTGSFDLKLRVAVFIAVFIGSPVWLYQVWAFFAPSLKRNEKLLAVGFLASAVPLFIAGAVVAWLVLPNIVTMLTSFSSEQDALLLNARDYLSFATRLMIAVGTGFVLPVFLVLLNFAGVLSAKSIIKSWRIAVLIIVFFAALTTPAADVVSMLLLAGSMIALYLIAALVCMLHDRALAKKIKTQLEV